MSEVNQAAERLRRAAISDFSDYPADLQMLFDALATDRQLLANAYLAANLPDDDEPITEAWITETYGKRDGAFGNWTIGSLELVCCFGWHLSRANPMVTINYIKTRGQLRLLLKALQ